MAQLIPLTSSPNQTLSVPLSVDGKTLVLQLTIYFNSMANYWMMDIADSAGNPMVNSLPMVTGSFPAANILEQHAYLQVGSAFIVNASGTPQDYPGSANLGSDFQLIWDDTPAN